jgi:alpha/beta superfamily hydrolase
LISPALDDPGWEDLTAYPNPKLILIGDSDEVVSFSRVKRYFTANKDFQVVAGADHFWRGYEHEVGARIGKFVKSRG